MKFHATALAIACAASSASAAVAQPRDAAETASKGKEFSIPQIRNERWKGSSAPAAYIAALAKYSPTLPDHLKHAIRVNPGLRRKFGGLLNTGKLTFYQCKYLSRRIVKN